MKKIGYLVVACASSQMALASQQQRELELPVGIVKCDEQANFGELIAYSESNPMPFCANNGVCKSDYAANPEQPCDCPAGYAGPHCEYKEDDVPACRLRCKNDGVCMIGVTSWAHLLDNSFRYQVNHDHQYCMCPKGYHGSLCEFEAEPCGADNFCYNGGSCVVIQKRDGTTSYNCDCTSAGDSYTFFAGEFCEYPASTFCGDNNDQNGRHFCVNGGSCQDESRLGCHCNEGFVGPLCEFADQNLQVPTCSLQCKNHGVCRKGAKDVSMLDRFGLNKDGHRHLAEKYNEDFEHCVCPAGYAGLVCEYKVDVCPGGEHACLNGGECNLSTLDGGDITFKCDCSSAKASGSLFAGGFCEMESTEYCTVDRMRPDLGLGQDAFCTNKGKCLQYVEHGESHPGCECPKGFYGDHCEYRSSGANGTETLDQTFLIILLAITILLMAACFYFFYKYSRRRGHVRKNFDKTVNMDAFDRSRNSSAQSPFGKDGPWKGGYRDDDDDGVLSIKDEADALTVNAGYARRKQQYLQRKFKETPNIEQRLSSGLFRDHPPSIASSVAVDSDHVTRDGILRFPQEQLKTPSFGSSHDGSLHLFNDSHDGGSVHIL
ncbi:hypothetical protein FisN_1Lh531 [Fistulifera solaris]|uniref:EGF-like domain-containing protein n=1 Tax=Fistulifera solaris TaxID=1519565 RepID=A0A1Z5K129_FISSO|nr:hypothetical protein FisN_1Lh531 [Fistulifera solaris]|eukprot:GAX19995.1 hypothetical protein FisN_1Lh531 [Fistulifera solaris]